MENINEKKFFDYDKNTKISLNLNKNKLNIEIINQNEFNVIKKFTIKNYEEFISNKYFTIFENMKEIYENIIEMIVNNKIKLKFDNNKCYFDIKFLSNKIFTIILYEKDEKENEIISVINSVIESINLKNDLNEKINYLKQNIDLMRNEYESKILQLEAKNNFLENKFIENKVYFENIIQNLKKEINYLNNSINNNKNENINNNKKENKIKNNKSNFNLLNYSLTSSITINPNNSKILLDEDFNFLFSNKNIYKDLLFCSDLYGDNILTYHNKCDKIPNTLTIIKTKENFIFGGFTTNFFESSPYTWKEDENSFIFSINLKKKFYPKDKKKAILSVKYMGPTFGDGYDVYLHDKFLSEEQKYYNIKDNTYNIKKYELTNGNKSYIINKVEVWKIQFD